MSETALNQSVAFDRIQEMRENASSNFESPFKSSLHASTLSPFRKNLRTMTKGFGNMLEIHDVPISSSRSKNEDKEHMVIDNKKYRIKDCYSETSEHELEDDADP